MTYQLGAWLLRGFPSSSFSRCRLEPMIDLPLMRRSHLTPPLRGIVTRNPSSWSSVVTPLSMYSWSLPGRFAIPMYSHDQNSDQPHNDHCSHSGSLFGGIRFPCFWGNVQNMVKKVLAPSPPLFHSAWSVEYYSFLLGLYKWDLVLWIQVFFLPACEGHFFFPGEISFVSVLETLFLLLFLKCRSSRFASNFIPLKTLNNPDFATRWFRNCGSTILCAYSLMVKVINKEHEHYSGTFSLQKALKISLNQFWILVTSITGI